MNNDDLVRAWIQTAEDEFEVYEILRKHNPEYTTLFRQKYQVLCQAFELALKALLISKGYSTKEVKKISHDLVKLLSIAQGKFNLLVSVRTQEIVRMISQDYKDRNFVYFVEQYRLPSNIEAFASTISLLLAKLKSDSQKSK